MKIDYVPWEDKDGKFRRIEIIIGDRRFVLKKNEAYLLWRILDMELNNMWIDETDIDTEKTLDQVQSKTA